MKKLMLIGLVNVLLLSIFTNIYPVEICNASGNTLYVGGGPGNYSSIQDAIDDANPGDTVYVYGGSYDEDVLINKRINLVGENKETTIVTRIQIDNTEYVNVSGFKLGIYYVQHNFIYVTNSPHTRVSNCIIDGSGNPGPETHGLGIHSEYVHVANNVIRNIDYQGIFGNFSYCTIENNTIYNMGANGIHIEGDCHHNTICNNEISDTGLWAIRLRISSVTENYIYHNNFIGETCYDQGGPNYWDDGYPSGGNYWSDYTGSDNDGDGIGDTPHTFSGGQDNYPFMNQDGWLDSPPPPNQAPISDFSWSADGLDVDFTDASTDSDGYTISWSWAFGDDTTSTVQNPIHTYTTYGIYSVTLTVTDNNGSSGSETKSIAVSQPSITVSSPNGGETWYKGNAYTIKWSLKNAGDYVKIELYKSGYSMSAIASSTSNDGSYDWEIPSTQTTSSYYEIKITSISDSTIYDDSDEYFSISDEPVITVTSPDSGEIWYKGDTYTITWTSENAGDYVKIELYENNSYVSTITSSTSNDGSYSWAIPSNLTTSSLYKIKIINNLDSTIYDDSDEYFSISDEPVITVTSPDSGEIWYKGDTYTITWTSENAGDYVKIALYKKSSSYYSSSDSYVKTIVSNISNDGSYSLVISNALASESSYKIKIIPLLDDSISGDSGYFAIETIPFIAVSSINENEIWYRGDTYTITWDSDNVGNYIKIELYKNDSYVMTIASDIDASSYRGEGYYQWAIPATLEPSSDYKIKIISMSDSSVCDYCDGYLAIKETWLQKWQWAIAIATLAMIILIGIGIRTRAKSKEKKRIFDKEKKEIKDIIHKATSEQKTEQRKIKEKKKKEQKTGKKGKKPKKK